MKPFFFAILFALVARHAVAENLSIVSYNIRYPNPGDAADYWPHRATAVGEFLKGHDVCGLQEAKFSQLADLDNILIDFDRYGVGRDDGKQAGESTSIYYRKDRFTLQDKGTIWLSEKPNIVGSKGWDAVLPRILSWVLIIDHTNKQPLLVANTHFDHRGKQARLESGRLIQAFLTRKSAELAKTPTDPLPIVLLGDFNCMIDSEPYKAITSGNESRLTDARHLSGVKLSGPNSTWCGFKAIAEGRIIDHIFVKGPLQVLELETYDPKTKKGRYASDHLPVGIQCKTPNR